MAAQVERLRSSTTRALEVGELKTPTIRPKGVGAGPAALSPIRRIPGFRSGEPWKAIFAAVGYCLVLAFAIDAAVDANGPPPGPTRFLRNGGFESGASGWDINIHATIDSNRSDAHSGSSSLMLTATAAWQSTSQAVIVA